MVSTGLLSPAALGFRVRRRGQPPVSLSICQFALLWVSHNSQLWVKAVGQGSDMVGKQLTAQILVYLTVIYVPGDTN